MTAGKAAKLAFGCVAVVFAICAISCSPPSSQVAQPAPPQSFQTQDNITIAAILSAPPNADTPHPGVIFIHQGGSSKEEWTQTRLYQNVVQAGMSALAYDVRGHGQSGGKGGFHLFSDPELAPKDLIAAIDYLAARNVDRDKIAIVGSSIGANLAIMAKGGARYNVKTVVAMSGKTEAADNLAGGKAEIRKLNSVYAIAGELEQGGKRAQWAQDFYERADAPRRLDIIKGSDGHGTSLFMDDPELEDRILGWLVTELGGNAK